MPKASIYLRDNTSAVIGPTEVTGLSGRIAAICSRYERIVRDLVPELSVGEWLAIMDANNGGSDVWHGAEHDSGAHGTMIWANIADSPGIGEKWDIDAKALVRRLQKLSAAELFAIDEVVARYWAIVSSDVTFDVDSEHLRAAWAKVKK